MVDDDIKALYIPKTGAIDDIAEKVAKDTAQWQEGVTPKINIPIDTSYGSFLSHSYGLNEAKDDESHDASQLPFSGYHPAENAQDHSLWQEMPIFQIGWTSKFALLCAGIFIGVNLFLSWALPSEKISAPQAEITFETTPAPVIASGNVGVNGYSESERDASDGTENSRVIAVTKQDKEQLLRYLKQPAAPRNTGQQTETYIRSKR